MFASEELRKERLDICKGCKHYFDNNWLSRIIKVITFGKVKTGTCGRPIIGKWIKIEGVWKKLCGCVMESKTALQYVECPIGKW